MSSREHIRVAVRIRPDEAGNERSCVSAVHTNGVLVDDVADPKGFSFDRVFWPESSQEEVYEMVDPLVQSALEGFNATIFAYGSTGSGKTFTISGHSEQEGIIPQAIRRIFEGAREMTERDPESLVLLNLSYIEIYNNQFRNLLDTELGVIKGQQKIELRTMKDGSTCLSPSLEVPIADEEEALQLIRRGAKFRETSVTDCNEHSSRSHAILTLKVESRDGIGIAVRVGKLHIVDLAGSERLSLSHSQGKTMKETQQINLSLSSLANVLSTLSSSQKGALVPYRNSKLTHFLKDSLGGNSKTLMIANVRTPIKYRQQTLMTLLYASRAKKIENNISVNTASLGASRTSELIAEVTHLRQQLRNREADFLRLSEEQGKGLDNGNELALLLQQNEEEKTKLENWLKLAIHNHKSTLESQHEDFMSMETKLREFQSLFAKQEHEIRTLRSSVKEISSGSEEEIDQLKGLIGKLSSALQSERQLALRKDRTLQERNEALRALKNQYDALKTASTETLRDFDVQDKEIQKLRIAAKEGCAECAKLKQKYGVAISNLQNEFDNLIQSKDVKIAGLEEKLADSVQMLESTKEIAEQMKSEIQQMNSQNENLSRNVSDEQLRAQLQLSSKDEEISNLKRKIGDLEEIRQNQETELQQMKFQNESFSRNQSDEQAKAQLHSSSKDEEISNLKRKIEDLEKIRQKHGEMSCCTNLKEKLSIQNEWIVDLKKQRAELEAQVRDMAQHNEKLKKSLEQVPLLQREIDLLKMKGKSVSILPETVKTDAKSEDMIRKRLAQVSEQLRNFIEEKQLWFVTKLKVKRALSAFNDELTAGMEDLMESCSRGSTRTKNMSIRRKQVMRGKIGSIESHRKKLRAELENVKRSQDSLLGQMRGQENLSKRANLIEACLRGEVEKVKETLETTTSSLRFLPLHRAISGFHFHSDARKVMMIIKMLVRAGAPINMQDGAGNTILHKVAQVVPDVDLSQKMIDALVSLGADRGIRNKLDLDVDAFFERKKVI